LSPCRRTPASAVQEVDDHLSRRRGLDVALADRGGRVDDHDRQPALSPRDRDALRVVLRFLVVADDAAAVDRGGLVGGRAVGGEPQRGDRARVDDARHAGLGRGARARCRCRRRSHGRARAVAHPEPVVRGDVVDGGDALHRRAIERGPSGPLDDLDGEAVEVVAPVRRAGEAPHGSPRASRARTTWAPTKPVPPVTRFIEAARGRLQVTSFKFQVGALVALNLKPGT
jgi:hypothetical protein